MKWLDEILSFLFKEPGNVIHCAQDEYGKIFVIENNGNRILEFDSLFEQSSMCVHRPHQLIYPYTQLMALVLAYIDPGHISLFGLGGGSLLRTFHHVLPSCLFHVVELRKSVVDIARKYFVLPDDYRVTITVGDAVKEISKLEDNSTDVIFSDMYDAYQMVPMQTQKSFLQDCSRILTRPGWLVINLDYLPSNRIAFFELLRSIFPTIILSATDENIILMVSKTVPESVRSDIRRITTIESLMQQPVSQLMPRLKPVNL